MSETTSGPRVLGLLTDPDPRASAHLVCRLADELPEAAADRFAEGFPWEVRVGTERIARGPRGRHGMVDRAVQRMQEEDWDAVVVIVDTPFRYGEHALAAEVTTGRRVGVLSLAACGAVQARSRAVQTLVEVVSVLGGAQRVLDPAQSLQDGSTHRLPGGIHRLQTDPGEEVDARFVAKAGRIRLLAGMVHSSYPWRLPLALTGSFIAALAFGMFWALSPTVWQLALELDWWRLAVLTLAAITGKVGWYIVAHRLWERGPPRGAREDPEEAKLFNLSTVVNMAVGVTGTYLALLVMLTVATVLIIDEQVLTTNVQQQTDLALYLKIGWFAASLGEIAGALGTKLDSDEAVRQVAYSAREHARPFAPESSRT